MKKVSKCSQISAKMWPKFCKKSLLCGNSTHYIYIHTVVKTGPVNFSNG